MTHTPAAFSDQLAIQARAIADRILGAAQEIRSETPDPNVPPVMLLATGPIAMEIYEGADCCVDDQLGLAVMLAAELALRASDGPGWQFLDHREINGRAVVLHWPATEEGFCVASYRPIRYEAGDRCRAHGDAAEPCIAGLRMPPECEHEHLSPNHPYPHCSECGQTAQDVTAKVGIAGPNAPPRIDRCDPSTGHHSTPHRGCILR